MARSTTLVLFLLWALLAAPALCMGGLLAHPCECEESAEAEECAHEGDCSFDPCDTSDLRGDGARAVDALPAPSLSNRLFQTWPSEAPAHPAPRGGPIDPDGLPCPPIDLPFLS